ncbi:MAG: cobyrinate a,c-diamide synthase [Anderseniella sp.]
MTAGLLIAAPSSGSGKTTVTLGLAHAWARSGVAVQTFKCGPDYIDPAFHAVATGRSSFNLDSWSMAENQLQCLARHGDDADLILAEGAMGLFDGVSTPGATGKGASADIASLMNWPVVLVLDVSSQAQSAAAIAQGFARFRKGVSVAGVILNKVASPRHEALVRDGMEASGIKVFGVLPRQKSIALPERHLGLIQAQEHDGLQDILTAAADFVSEHCDLDALRRVADGSSAVKPADMMTVPPGQRIAIASDAAFSFVYPHMLENWRRAGADVLPFSPLADEAPDRNATVCWLPGGYPELHGGTLAGADKFRKGLQEFAKTRPVHGECGGYMAMGEGLVDKQGTHHRMAGLLGLVTSYEKRKLHLGYRVASLGAAMPGFAAGAVLRGHEFHYSTILEQPDEPLAEVTDANGASVPESGSQRGLATGTFFHLISEVT